VVSYSYFVTQDGAVCLKIFVVIIQKLYVVYEAKNCMGNERHKYYKHTKFYQNPRSDLTIPFQFDFNQQSIYVATTAIVVVAKLHIILIFFVVVSRTC